MTYRNGNTVVRFQELPMRNKLFLVCLLLVALVGTCSAAEPNALHGKIHHDTTIQGFPCAHGDAWFYPDGSLNQCTLSRPVTLGDLRIPGHSVIELWPNGTAHYLMLSHAAALDGYRVRGADRLGLSRGATTAFYRTGELHSLFLVSSHIIQGVPCCGGAWNTFADPTGNANMVEFYKDGTLQSCKLSRSYLSFRAGERIALPHLTTAAANPTPTETTKTASAR
jgi:hypothetical protein